MMGGALRTIINPVGALLGLPDPVLDKVLPAERQKQAATPTKRTKSLAAQTERSVANSLRIDDGGR